MPQELQEPVRRRIAFAQGQSSRGLVLPPRRTVRSAMTTKIEMTQWTRTTTRGAGAVENHEVGSEMEPVVLGQAVCEWAQADTPPDRLGGSADVVLGHAFQASVEHEVLTHRQQIEQRVALWAVANAALYCGRRAGDWVAANERVAGCGRDVTAQH